MCSLMEFKGEGLLSLCVENTQNATKVFIIPPQRGFIHQN